MREDPRNPLTTIYSRDERRQWGAKAAGKGSPAPDWLIERGIPVGKGDHPLRELMADLLDEMEPDDRRILEAWAWEGLTYREIAEEFGLAGRQGGHYRVQAALKRLRKLLEERGINYDSDE